MHIVYSQRPHNFMISGTTASWQSPSRLAQSTGHASDARTTEPAKTVSEASKIHERTLITCSQLKGRHTCLSMQGTLNLSDSLHSAFCTTQKPRLLELHGISTAGVLCLQQAALATQLAPHRCTSLTSSELCGFSSTHNAQHACMQAFGRMQAVQTPQHTSSASWHLCAALQATASHLNEPGGAALHCRATHL